MSNLTRSTFTFPKASKPTERVKPMESSMNEQSPIPAEDEKLRNSIVRIVNDMTPDYDDELLELMKNHAQKKYQEAEKAYGGCRNCYGKGYATQDSATIGYPDFIGDEGFKYYEHKIIFCACSRGKQLETLLSKKYQEGELNAYRHASIPGYFYWNKDGKTLTVAERIAELESQLEKEEQ